MNVHHQLETSSVAKFRRRLVWLPVVLVLALCYVAGYYHLSRHGLAEAAPLGVEGFLYMPLDEAVASKNLSQHYLLSSIFAPLNLLDRQLFGTPGPVKCILFDLS